jgi:hypothetical protein
MAVYTDILIADASEAKAILASEAHNEEWHGLSAKGLDPAELAGLLSVFSNQPDQPDLVDEFQIVAEEDTENGPWVYSIPDRLIDHVAALEQSEIDHVARRWAEEAGVPPYMVERTIPPSSGGLLKGFSAGHGRPRPLQNLSATAIGLSRTSGGR